MLQALAEVVRQLPRMAGAEHDGVLFDLDGVLVDSRAAITGCINHALVEHEFAARPPESLHRFIGPSLADAFAAAVWGNSKRGRRRPEGCAAVNLRCWCSSGW